MTDEDYDDLDDRPLRRNQGNNAEVPEPPFYRDLVMNFLGEYEPASQFDEEAQPIFTHELRDIFQSYQDFTTGADGFPQYREALIANGFSFSIADGCIFVKPRIINS